LDYQVPSVALAARVLKLLSRHKYRQSTLTEIAERLGVNKTTCLRVLRTLEREDFVSYDPQSRRYSLGPYLIPLGARAADLNDVYAHALAELHQVAAHTGMTAVLVKRLRDDRVIYIGSAEPPGDGVRIAVSVGQQFPVYGAAFGRCFLAYDDESTWRRVLREGLKAYTPNSITDEEEYVRLLQEVREKGYAVSHGELWPGISAVAVPVFNQQNKVDLVLSCLTMTSVIQGEDVERAVKALKESAAKVSAWSGYQGRA